jgi:hypothetical protein
MPPPSIPESVRSSQSPAAEEASSAEHLASVPAHVVDDVFHSYLTKAAEAAATLVEKITDLVAGIAHSVGELLDGIPVPTAPTPGPDGKSLPAAGSLFLSGSQASSGSAPVLLIAVLALFSIALLQGKLPWLRCEPIRPRAGPQLPIERPG